MSRINTFLLVFMLLSAFYVLGCKKDKETSLIGTFGRTQQFGTEFYKVELQFTSDGLLIWTPVDEIPGHTASTVKYDKQAEDRFRIYDDTDCGNEGTYFYSANEDGLEITALTDECDPRKNAMSGYWERK